ncbi:hypothetical protein H7849_21490 [Alloacidobacterium dinghuense]|uniref:Uncharacterized protein n=1 Tax=Alloacidobacterium dinghuense TaxID=2763107 RepID=A0A7G8BGE0_9BACT|nr:hypothetical protein [Alloacidobacterium dinghuense]QNI31610.1 hypothetical protein H7849_21490 [Alloacidobacterium dinghuense]
MILTIDNLDGTGDQNYTSAVIQKTPLRIERQLNEPSICTFALAAQTVNLPVPLRLARVVVSDDGGVVLFTGYIASEPALELVGEGMAGPVYQAVVSAVSDEVLLDMQGLALMTSSFGLPAGQLVGTLTNIVDPTRFSLSTSQAAGTVGRFTPEPAKGWSGNVGTLASSSRNMYRVMSGDVTMTPIGNVTHSLSENSGTLQVNKLQASMIKMLANDVTVCGEDEPSAYVTEVFAGDGTTILFDLTEDPYFPPSSKTKPLADLFQSPSINTQLWQLQDPGAHISLTSNGLTCVGGNGLDGETTLCANGNLELGGSLVIETNGLVLSAGSTGILSGLYGGDVNTADCLAGFQVHQANGATCISPLIAGLAAGSSFTPVAGQIYTLRTRLYAKEMQRVLQSYYSLGDEGTELWGSSAVPCGLNLVLEVQDMTNGVNSTPVVLYDGAMAITPSICTFGLLNSTNLICSIRSVDMTQGGPVWVTSIPPGSNMITQRIGTTAQGADCKIERTGKLRFYATNVPQAGEQVFVSYRTKRRAVARMANAVATSPQNSSQLPATARWIGSVTSPHPISSADCENAALALLSLSSSRAAAWKGTYTGWNMETQGDIWPGDLLAVTAPSANLSANLVVRGVQIEVSNSSPQMNKYTIHFANDWADALAIKTSSAVPADTWLPLQPRTVEPLANLLTLSPSSITASTLQVNAGVTAPSGGGFEVRRRDWSFGPGTDSDLVLRSPVSSFTIPREAVTEQYYVRMYDGSTPPNYSRFSSAIFVNVPM